MILIISQQLSASDLAKQVSAERQQQWINIFPVGTSIQAVKFDPQNANILYAATHKGLLQSIDENTWLPLKLFDAGQEAESNIIAFNPIDAHIMYWGITWSSRWMAKEGSLWISKDGGSTWGDIASGVIKSAVNGIVFKPFSSEVIYVATSNGPGGGYGGLYKTLNGGKTWGKLADEADSVFINPDQPSEVYATFEYISGYTKYKGLYHSIDEGLHFDLIKPTYSYTSTEENPFNGKRYAVNKEGRCENFHTILNPQNTNEMLGACYSQGWQTILKSVDGGNNWGFLDEQFRQFASGNLVKYWLFDPENNDTIYFIIEENKWPKKGSKKILKSEDDGRTWTELPIPATIYNNITGIYKRQNEIYITSNYGIFKTNDGGANWVPLNYGLPARIGDNKLLFIDHEGTIYVGNGTGYWQSVDKGKSWQWSGISDFIQLLVLDDKTSYIARKEATNTAWHIKVTKQLLDRAVSEIKINSNPRYIAASISNAQTLYAVASEQGGYLDQNSIILKSEDSGFSWSDMDWLKWLNVKQKGNYKHDIVSLIVDSQSADILYGVIKHDRLGFGNEPPRQLSIIKTVDGGKTWADISQNIFVSITGIAKADDLSASIILRIAPTNSSILYFTNGKGIYSSTDGGKTWKSKSTLLKNVVIKDIAIDTKNPKSIYIASSKGVYKSITGGDTWQLINNGLYDVDVRRILASSSMVLAEGENGIYMLQPFESLK